MYPRKISNSSPGHYSCRRRQNVSSGFATKMADNSPGLVSPTMYSHAKRGGTLSEARALVDRMTVEAEATFVAVQQSRCMRNAGAIEGLGSSLRYPRDQLDKAQ